MMPYSTSCRREAPVDCNASMGAVSTFSIVSAKSFPKIPPVCTPKASTPGNGPRPVTKTKISAHNNSGTVRNRLATTRAVQRFREKPAPAQAEALFRRGALWNSFIGVAQATTVWEMIRQTAPDLYQDFMTIRRALDRPHVAEVISNVYRDTRAVNFSSEVCVLLPSRLRVLPAPEVGWSDWGSVERICASFEQLGKREESLARTSAQKSEAR